MKATLWIAKLLFVAGIGFLGFGVYLVVLLVNGKGGIPGFFGIIALFSNTIALAAFAFLFGGILWFVSRRKRGGKER